MEPGWLTWARRLQAIAQAGLHYSGDPFDRERFAQVREVAAAMLADATAADRDRLLDLLSRDVAYPTPKVDVRGVVFEGDGILLVRERSDGRWTLPGGFADLCESPSENVVKEIEEEAGLRTRAVRLLAVYDRNRHGHPPALLHLYKLFFRCEIVGGSLHPGIETTDAGFFPEDRLPPLSTGRVVAAQIARMFEHERRPDLPADFD